MSLLIASLAFSGSQLGEAKVGILTAALCPGLGWAVFRVTALLPKPLRLRALTAVTGGFAVALGIVLGVPDQIFATTTQYALVAAVAVAGAASTTCSAALQRRHS